MQKKRLLFVFLVGIAVVAAAVFHAEEPKLIQQPINISSLDQNDPEVRKMLQLLQEARTEEDRQKILKGLEALELERERLQGRNLSDIERLWIAQEKQRSNQERLREIQGRGITEQAPSVPSEQLFENMFVGIIEGDRSPAAGSPTEFHKLNFWGGKVDGTYLAVYAGFYPQDPLQGAIAIFDKTSTKQNYYPAPTLTGPLRVIAEANGILTLKSEPGEWEKYDELSDRRLKIQVPGGATYFFDLRARSYRQ